MAEKVNSSEFVSTRETAKILGVTPRTLQKWRERGRGGLPYYTYGHGHTVRYRRSDIEKFISEARVEPER